MHFTKTTEQASKYEHLEQMSVHDLLTNINKHLGVNFNIQMNLYLILLKTLTIKKL